MTSAILAMEDVRKYFPVKRSFLEGIASKRTEQVHSIDGVSRMI